MSDYAMNSPVNCQKRLSLEVPSSSFHRYGTCLPSPADPSRWEGASCRARFGLDIGGTLCKVVYFEPFDNLESPAEVSKNTCPSDFEGATKTRISCNSTANSLTSGEVTGCDTRQALRSPPWNKQDSELNTDGQSSSLEYSLARSSLDCESNYGKLASEGEPMDRVKSLNQVRKIWISSHDPVVLPGRGTLYFKCFETWRMEEFLLLSKAHSLVSGDRVLGATGGGARKFKNQFLQIAGLQLNHADELKSLVRGIDFLMKHAQHESVEYPKGSFQGGAIQRPLWSAESGDTDNDDNIGVGEHDKGCSDAEEVSTTANASDGRDELEKEMVGGVKKVEPAVVHMGPTCGLCIEGNRNLYPYLVVNIGSGVSILLVESPEHFQRVGGTSLGGSTFFGLASILTGCESFEEAIDLAAEGDSTEIDMLVGDIYGGDYSEMGLAATTVASSFGKLVHPARRAMVLNRPQHLAKATLLMITNNIGSLAKLHAQATGVEHVLFTGSFMHGNKLAMRLLTVAMDFWSKGEIKAIFLRHEGHAGAMGALLSTLDLINPTDALLLS